MPAVTITIADTPTGGVSIRTDFAPAAGNPCSVAQAAALDIIRRTRKEYGLGDDPAKSGALVPLARPVDGVDIDAVHRSRDGVVCHLIGSPEPIYVTAGVDVTADGLSMVVAQ